MTPAAGNRCGHDPSSPRLELARPLSSRRLQFITDAIEALKTFAYNAALFPELEGDRQRRSERRESIVLVGTALLYRYDLLSTRVGEIQDDGSCKGIEVERLARWTGCHPGRVARALADLRDAGFERSWQPYELRDGKYKGFAAIRMLTLQFFKRLGLSVRLGIERRAASKRWKRRAARLEAARPVNYRIRRDRRRLLRVQREREARLAGAVPAGAPVHSQERMRRWTAILLELRREHPDWSQDQVRAEATARLNG